MSAISTVEPGRRTTKIDALKHAITDHIVYTLARERSAATDRDVYMSAAWAIRDRLAEHWAATQQTRQQNDAKRVYYLSLEFLMGRTLGNALINLGLNDAAAEALHALGYELEELEQREPDAGLGNGGLGRLAACYMDSMATLGLAGWGYGIRYEHGIFRQRLEHGRQLEMPDNWLQQENPWEIARPDRTYTVQFGGRIESRVDENGRTHFRWVETQDVLAMAYDTPVPGYRNKVVNTLRLWAARATEEFDLGDFIRGNYLSAVQSKMQSETISKVLYPPDDTGSGKELRLKQQFFFVSATLQDIIRRYKQERKSFTDFPDKVQIQLNDTHPAVGIPELMRLLMDDEGLEWNVAWDICRRTFAYTNHTVLPEALETWSVDLFGGLLPRHLQIVEEIDGRLRARVEEAFPGEVDRVQRMAILADGQVRMASLAIAGSHTVNGVAELHTQIVRERIFRDFHELWPEKIISITNGVTQRRWMLKANRRQSQLITEAIGEAWIRDLPRLQDLEPFADDAEFRAKWRAAKLANKRRLVDLVRETNGLELDVGAIFDTQVKRIHEYKRQLLNALRLVDLYLRLRDDPGLDVVPRAVLFGGKAAPTYWTAKSIIKLISDIGEVVERDATVRDKLRVAFIPNYGVSQAEIIIPGSDLSEQISTAGYEASGTGNMKYALNGALTIGTLDGANVEIAEAVGAENMFIFGMTAEQVAERTREGYQPRAVLEANPRLQRVLEAVRTEIAADDPGAFQPLIDQLVSVDQFMLLADFDAYLEAQDRVGAAYRDQEEWTRRSILNVARSGHFSSDRSVEEYARRIWRL